MYFSGQGSIYLASTTNGVPGAFRFVGDATLQIALSTDVVEHQESTSGQRLIDARLQRNKKAELALTLDDWSKENLALGFYGQSATIAGGTVTAEVLPAALVNNDYVRLAQQDVSSVVVKDSAGTPATLVAGTNYKVSSAKHGSLQILNVGSYVQPFKVDYSYAGGTNIALFTQAAPERWLRFEGINTADANKTVLIELYRALFDPSKALDVITDDFGKLELSGSCLYDATKVGDSTLGQLGRFMHLT